MSKQLVILRADAGSKIGFGHVSRLLALAEMLVNDFDLKFIVCNPAESVLKKIKEVVPDTTVIFDSLSLSFVSRNGIVVLDGYHFDKEYQIKLKQLGVKVVYVDDLVTGTYVADVVINHALSVKSSDYVSEGNTEFYLGADYILLRKAFLKDPPRAKQIQSIEKVLITMGGSDEHNVTLKVLKVLSKVSSVREMNVLIGSVNLNRGMIEAFVRQGVRQKVNLIHDVSSDEVCELMRSNDLIVCPASSTLIEACAIGMAIVSGFTANNQLKILKGLEDLNCLTSLGDFLACSEMEMLSFFEMHIKNMNLLNIQILNQQKVIDRKSPERIRYLFKKLTNATRGTC